jgi:hypothetical protein
MRTEKTGGGITDFKTNELHETTIMSHNNTTILTEQSTPLKANISSASHEIPCNL